jgi:dipeptide/tripeptide permease
MLGPLQNYISNRYKDDANPGALGLGQSAATAMTSAFTAWCYITPLIGAIVADQYLGKYKTILAFSAFYVVGLFVLFVSSLPAAIEGDVALAGLIIAMLVIGVGTGGIKSNVSPLIAEQLTETRHRTKFLKNGEKVLVDPELTVQRVYMIFYLCINIGALSGMATTSLELHVGFWSAYGLSLITFIAGVGVLVWGRKQYVDAPPKGSVVIDSFRVIWMAIRSGQGLAIAKPSVRRSMKLPIARKTWSDSFVDELETALGACKVFMFYPFYWVVFNQMQNNFVSQAGTMELHGIPVGFSRSDSPLLIRPRTISWEI